MTNLQLCLYEFISIYIAQFIAELITQLLYHQKQTNNYLSNIVFSSIYILIFAAMNNIRLTEMFPKQHFTLFMVILPLIVLILNEKSISFNRNFINSVIVESFSAAIVEEALFRKIIPSNFTNKFIGIIVSGILFSIIHIKSLSIDVNLLYRLITTSMLFNILMFQVQPNNILFHFMWNFITISIFTTPDISGTTITPLEISNTTIILLAISILIKTIF